MRHVQVWNIFVGKGYESGGLFRFSLIDSCDKIVNHVCSDD
jgi:hypothetical protein